MAKVCVLCGCTACESCGACAGVLRAGDDAEKLSRNLRRLPRLLAEVMTRQLSQQVRARLLAAAQDLEFETTGNTLATDQVVEAFGLAEVVRLLQQAKEPRTHERDSETERVRAVRAFTRNYQQCATDAADGAAGASTAGAAGASAARGRSSEAGGSSHPAVGPGAPGASAATVGASASDRRARAEAAGASHEGRGTASDDGSDPGGEAT